QGAGSGERGRRYGQVVVAERRCADQKRGCWFASQITVPQIFYLFSCAESPRRRGLTRKQLLSPTCLRQVGESSCFLVGDYLMCSAIFSRISAISNGFATKSSAPAASTVTSALGWAENIIMGMDLVSSWLLRCLTISRPSFPESKTSRRMRSGRLSLCNFSTYSALSVVATS